MGKLPTLGNPGSSHQFGIRISLVPWIQLHRAKPSLWYPDILGPTDSATQGLCDSQPQLPG